MIVKQLNKLPRTFLHTWCILPSSSRRRRQHMDRLQQAAAQQQGGDGEFTAAARTLLLQNLNLQDRFEKDVAPAMELLEAARQQLAEHTWAYGVFLPDFDEARRDELLKGRRVTQAFWRDVQAAYQPKADQLQVITKQWWTNNWIGRGRQYRLLVEPLDIANWYRSDFHVKGSGHYIDIDNAGDSSTSSSSNALGPTLEDEIAVDNKRRPGRYLMLQRVEAEAEDQGRFGLDHMQSSLDTARWLKENVGDKSWEQFVATL